MTVLFTVREAVAADAAAVAEIYNGYIRDTIITFEENPIDVAELGARMAKVQGLGLPWLVLEDSSETLCGYAYAGEWKPRAAYRHAVEVSVYLRPDRARRGMGTALYSRLFELLPAAGVHAVLAGIALPNEISIGLHEKFGMTKVAHMPQVGKKFGQWIDVAYWQRVFEEQC